MKVVCTRHSKWMWRTDKSLLVFRWKRRHRPVCERQDKCYQWSLCLPYCTRHPRTTHLPHKLTMNGSTYYFLSWKSYIQDIASECDAQISHFSSLDENDGIVLFVRGRTSVTSGAFACPTVRDAQERLSLPISSLWRKHNIKSSRQSYSYEAERERWPSPNFDDVAMMRRIRMAWMICMI